MNTKNTACTGVFSERRVRLNTVFSRNLVSTCLLFFATVSGVLCDENNIRQSNLHVATIDADTFVGSRGVISVNVAAGDHNHESNSVFLNLSATALPLEDSFLSKIIVGDLPSINPNPEASEKETRSAHLSQKAFSNSSGVIQVNQIAGKENRLSNRLSVHLPPAAFK